LGSFVLGGSQDSSSPVDEAKTTTLFFADFSWFTNLSTFGVVPGPAFPPSTLPEKQVSKKNSVLPWILLMYW
jgi:hypothetical protein